MLAADFVRERILRSGAPLRRFKVAVFSGIFFHPISSQWGAGMDPFSVQMQDVFAFANMSIPPGCRAQHPTDPSACILGLHPLEAIPSDMPIFVEQSVLDRWQTGCVLGAQHSRFELVRCSTAPGWDDCLRYMEPLLPNVKAVARCALRQRVALDAFQLSFEGALRRSATLQRPGNAGFVHGCHSHCPGSLHAFVVDGVSLDDAVVSWWRAPMGTPARVYSGCLANWSDLGPPRSRNRATCRPRCGALYAWPDGRRQQQQKMRTVELALTGSVSKELKYR